MWTMHFETLANEHEDAVYRQMVRVCGNHEDAVDVLVEALLKAYRHLDQLRDSVAFRPWLAQIAKRVCWQLKARESLLPLMQLSELEEEGTQMSAAASEMETHLASQQMKELLNGAIASLPSDCRSVFELRDVQDLSGSEVAEHLGISLAAMKSRLQCARALLRERLDAVLMGNTTA
jgi:RNA polymerase sigma-70 factor (ECF subfamily)